MLDVPFLPLRLPHTSERTVSLILQGEAHVHSAPTYAGADGIDGDIAAGTAGADSTAPLGADETASRETDLGAAAPGEVEGAPDASAAPHMLVGSMLAAVGVACALLA